MNYQFTNDKPIYLQLMDAFKTVIVSGELKPGDRLDSVRDLAVQAKVNPNTMQKALSELEREGFIRTERTSGRFISENEDLLDSMKDGIAETEINLFIQKMKSFNYGREEILNLVKQALENEGQIGQIDGE